MTSHLLPVKCQQITLFDMGKQPAGFCKEVKTIIGGRIVCYELRQCRRRLSIKIDDRGMRVSAPKSISSKTIHAFLEKNTEWILKQLSRFDQKPAPLVAKDGEIFSLLGSSFTLCLAKQKQKPFLSQENCTLTLFIPKNQNPKKCFKKALMDFAKSYFTERVAHFSPKIQSTIPPIRLSSARTLWGSCSLKNIRFNWRLIHLSEDIIDYVIAHELAHLKEMNHSKHFWAEVERLYPPWKQAEQNLHEKAAGIPIF